MARKHKLFDSINKPVKEEQVIFPSEDVEQETQTSELKPNILKDLGEPHPISVDYYVKVACTCLNSYYKPDFEAAIHHFLFQNEVHHVYGEMNGWGQIGEKDWIRLEYTEKL